MPNPVPVDPKRSPYSSGAQKPLYNLSSKTYQTPTKLPVKAGTAWMRVMGMAVLGILIAGITFGVLEYSTLRNNLIVKGEGKNNNLLSYTSSSKADWSHFVSPGDGRYNILILGIGGINDQGQAHDGTLLTDSIQVLSLDTVNKKISITSVPRDFYYNISGHGPNKINAVYEFGEMDHPGLGGQAAREAFGKVLGTNISNFITVDFTAAKDVVNAVGGIDINVPKALYDPSFPCDDDIHYCPFSIAAGPTHMNGDVALKYSRSRHADSDYGRSSRQQEVITAIKKKALSLGTLSNPVTITNLLTSLSKHIKTDMQPSEITSFLAIYKDVTTANTVTNVLDTSTTLGLLTSKDDPYVGFTSYPLDGYTAYDSLHQWYQKNNPDPFIAKESATVSVVNGGQATSKQIQAFVQKLKDYGFNASSTVTATPLSHYASTHIFAKDTTDKPVTANYLGSVLGVSVDMENQLGTGSNFEIVYVPSRGGN